MYIVRTKSRLTASSPLHPLAAAGARAHTHYSIILVLYIQTKIRYYIIRVIRSTVTTTFIIILSIGGGISIPQAYDPYYSRNSLPENRSVIEPRPSNIYIYI